MGISLFVTFLFAVSPLLFFPPLYYDGDIFQKRINIFLDMFVETAVVARTCALNVFGEPLS